jgi:SAM-dependent methyltransferase
VGFIATLSVSRYAFDINASQEKVKAKLHASSLQNMAKCYERFVAGTDLERKETIEVLDVGGADVNGSYRRIFNGPNVSYRAADLQPGNGVDVVLQDPYRLPFPDGEIDLVISGQMFEHCEFFWLAFREMVRVLHPEGYLFLIAPSSGGVHRYPVDCYRFNPDSYQALAKYGECFLVDSWQDERGPFRDLVGVFSRSSATRPPTTRVGAREISSSLAASLRVSHSNEPLAERPSGSREKPDVLRSIHRALKPSNYLEIGVDKGASLRLADCTAIGIDPRPQLEDPLPKRARLFECSSDEFFDVHAKKYLKLPIDFAFIDGMHLFEFALRDFMNVERHASPAGLIAVDDVLPNHPLQAARRRQTVTWTGDVWKLTDCLSRYRPDLALVLLDAWPTGLLVIAGLDPTNRILWDEYDTIVFEYTAGEFPPPVEVLERHNAVDTGSSRFQALVTELPDLLHRGSGVGDVQRRLSSVGLVRTSSRPRVETSGSNRAPELSLVVATYNMSRELPRTIRSLSPVMQLGISTDEYEIVVVDNGSTEPTSEAELRRWGANVRFVSFEGSSPSPVGAINHGLSLARGELCGVMIDGAHLASPGLLAGALDASRIDPRAVITPATFHLGHEIQNLSTSAGYDRENEDRLLDEIAWTEDGYRLFKVSVPFGVSHRGGWFVPHLESNALFMTAAMWREIGGYDVRYRSPGGGLVSMDTFRRASELPHAQLVVLLGEGVFHQVHDGITTSARLRWNDVFTEENRRISGGFGPPRAVPIFFGSVHPEALALSAMSAKRELEGDVVPMFELPALPPAKPGGYDAQGAEIAERS